MNAYCCDERNRIRNSSHILHHYHDIILSLHHTQNNTHSASCTPCKNIILFEHSIQISLYDTQFRYSWNRHYNINRNILWKTRHATQTFYFDANTTKHTYPNKLQANCSLRNCRYHTMRRPHKSYTICSPETSSTLSVSNILAAQILPKFRINQQISAQELTSYPIAIMTLLMLNITSRWRPWCVGKKWELKYIYVNAMILQKQQKQLIYNVMCKLNTRKKMNHYW